MPSQNFRVKNGLEVGTNVTISAGIITATTFSGALNSSNITATTVTATSYGNVNSTTLNVSGVSTFGSSIYLGDGDVAYFGDGQDLLIWHNSTDSIIRDNGTGDLLIEGGNRIKMTNPTGIETYAVFNQDSAVELWYDNSKKLETTGYGATVYGTLSVNGNIGIGTTNPSAVLHLKAGTASASTAPLKLTSGINLTTAEAGAVEYDGNVFYSTPAARGLSPSMMFYRMNSDYTGSNGSTAQSLFNVGVTLAANTVYAFTADFLLSKTAGSTNHTLGILFGGAATLNNIFYTAYVTGAAVSPPTVNTGSTIAAHITIATIANLTSATASTVIQYGYTYHGTVSISSGGTFIPQYKLSAAPGGAYSTIAGSFFAIWPIGASGANTSVGPWA